MTYTNAATVARRRHHRRMVGLGAGAPASNTSAAPDMTFSLADPDVAAAAAVSAIMSASASQLRSSIAAVRDFQTAYGQGLAVDGIYGPNTRAALVAVTGRTDLPSTGSSGSSGGSVSTSTSSYTASPPLAPTSSTPSWLIPVAVVSTLVIVAGGLMLTRRRPAPVAARSSVRRNGRRRRM